MALYCTGFHTEGEGLGPGISPLPEILKLSMVIFVLSQVLNNNLVPDCVRSNLRGSKFKIFLGGACPKTPLVGMHTYAGMSMFLHTTIILLHTILFPPPTQNPLWNSAACFDSICRPRKGHQELPGMLRNFKNIQLVCLLCDHIVCVFLMLLL